MKSKILVVGGYGEVGQHAIRTLLALGHEVLIAGRNEEKGARFLNELRAGAKAQFLKLDLNSFSKRDLKTEVTYTSHFSGIAAVLMCTEANDTAFTEFCLKQRVRYFEISADQSYLARIESLSSLAKENKSSVVLSVGLAPGLTNLLAVDVLKSAPEIESLEIGILLGTGDSHGAQAVDWTLKYTLNPTTGTECRFISFGTPWGNRKAHAFDFADQHALMKSAKNKHHAFSNLRSVSTYLALSSRLLTTSLFLLRGPLFNTLARAFYKPLLTLFSRPLGWDRGYAITVRGFAKGNSIPVFSQTLTGKVEALITGVTAAGMIHHFQTHSLESGVHHSHEVLELKDLRATLEIYGGLR